MSRLPPRPKLQWKQDDTPVETGVDDVFYSVEDGLEEARAVFLAGCGLPGRWAGRDSFTVAELGFGTGLNFLATWQMWRANRGEFGWLNFVSFEGFPLDKGDAARALSAWPELAQLSEKLIENWPVRAKGVARVVWPDERLTLTLHLGDIGETLAQSRLKADAWFLDGFSPAKNGAMWDKSLWPLVSERCEPGAKLATFTVAGAVRRGLEAAGFSVDRLPGHGRKRQRLEAISGRYESAMKGLSTGCRVAIIGAGIAGASAAQAFMQRGAAVSVFDAAAGPAQGTSGNPLALVMPRLDAGDTVEARLVLDAYLHAQASYRGLAGVEPVEVVHHPRDDKEAARFAKMLADPPLGPEQLEAMAGGIVHKGAMILRPGLLLPALLDGADLRWGCEAVLDAGARTVNGEVFDAVVLANGWQMHETAPWLRLEARPGQIEWLEGAVDRPPSAIVRSDYALASGHERLWGATFGDHAGGPAATSAAARAENRAALNRLAPDWQQDAERCEIQSRAGIRASTPDRLPVVGALVDYPAVLEVFAGLRDGLDVAALVPEIAGVFVAGGFGARGFTWGPWAGAVLAAQVFGDPAPATAGGLQAVAPVRQVLRDLKRGLV